MSDARVRALLETRLKTWADENDYQVEFENMDLSPPNDTYLSAFVLPAPTTSQDFAGAMRTYIGVFQINISCPRGQGRAKAQEISGLLAALFPVNARMTDSDGFVLVTTTPLSIASGLPTSNRYVVPTSLQYRMDTA